MSVVCNSDNFFGISKGHRKMFDIDFLYSYYSKLCFQLNQIFDEDKTAAECFLHSEYKFRGRDWTSGETWTVSLSRILFATMKNLNWVS